MGQIPRSTEVTERISCILLLFNKCGITFATVYELRNEPTVTLLHYNIIHEVEQQSFR